MILGFGATEKEAALQIISECSKALKAEGFEGLNKTKERYMQQSELFKAMTRESAPERYSYFYFRHHEIYEGRHLVEFMIHHINNRRPDGWDLFVTKWALSLDSYDDDDGDYYGVIYCEA